MATKEHRRHAKGLIEGLEARVHVGPPVLDTEIHSAREFLQRNDFAPSSDYFGRLSQIQNRLVMRAPTSVVPSGKRNYGGAAAGRLMQLLSVYDHIILSTCYEGEVAFNQGKVKISHRFNQSGRIDFVELKFLRSLESCLTGELRTLIRIKDYPTIRRDWWESEAFVLPVLPRELVFLNEDIFRFPRHEVLGWLVNIGHRLAEDLVTALQEAVPANSCCPRGRNGDQLSLSAVRRDEVGWPILEQATGLECSMEMESAKSAVVRYASR